MPQFKVSATALKSEIKTLKYEGSNETRKSQLEQLQKVAETLNQNNNVQLLVLLGAILFTKARIAQEYTLTSPSGSRLHESLGELSICKELNKLENKPNIEALATRLFYQWYHTKAYKDGQKIMDDPLCGKSDDHKIFIPVLENMAKELPPITKKQFNTIKQGMSVQELNYDSGIPEKTAAGSIFNLFGLFGGSSTTEVLAKAEAEAETAKETATATAAI